MISYGRQDINEEDIAAVCAVLKSDFLTQGPAVEAFEKKFAKKCGVRHAVAVSNATAALHLACLSLDLKAGDLAWTSPNTFVASSNCALYCGADVDFIDIDQTSWNLSPSRLAEKLAEAKLAGRLPKIIIPVHFAGRSCDMAMIARLAREYGVAIVEDASHAVGAKYAQAPVGACAYSDCAVFSFHPVKILTTGEGGVVVTNRDDLAERLRRLRSHGITRDTRLMQERDPGDWCYEQLELGYNYRMTDIQAALGSSQLNRLDAFVTRRQELAAEYSSRLAHLPIQLPMSDANNESAWHLYTIRLQLDAIPKTHRQVFDELRVLGVGVNLHYMPVYLQPFYRRLGFSQGLCPEAERYAGEAITLPLYPKISVADFNTVVESIDRVLS